MDRRIGILVCSVLAEEMAAVVTQNQWHDVEIIPVAQACLPGTLQPELSALEPLPEATADLDLHFFKCACHVVSPLPDSLEQNTTLHPVSNCFRMLLPAPLVDHYTGNGGHLVTPGWVRHWERNLLELGLDQASARDLFQETARTIVLLDTGTCRDAQANCENFAAYLGLPWEAVPTGLELATRSLESIVLEARLAQQVAGNRRLTSELQAVRASFHLLLDIQSELLTLRDEAEILDKLHEMFTLLFSPTRVHIVSMLDNQLHTSRPENLSAAEAKILVDFLNADPIETHRATPEGRGFMVRFGRLGPARGGALLADFTFPQHHEEYLNQTLTLAPVCKIVIDRARSLQGIIPVCSFCHQIRDKQGDWSRFEAYISSHSEALFSHTICPVCLQENYGDLIKGPDLKK